MPSIITDYSIAAKGSSLYWRKLMKQNEEFWGNWVKDLPERSIALSLLYYYRDELQRSDNSAIKDLTKVIDSETHKKDLEYLDVGSLNALSVLPQEVKLADNTRPTGEILKAKRLVDYILPGAGIEMDCLMTGVFWVEGEYHYSLTAPLWYGAIFMGEMLKEGRYPMELAVSLAHEAGHLALITQCSIAPPLENNEIEFYSPFKGKLRPAIAVLHAQVALARMLFFIHSAYIKRDELDAEVCQQINWSQLDILNEEYTEHFLAAMDSIEKMDFTAEGELIREDFRSLTKILKTFNI